MIQRTRCPSCRTVFRVSEAQLEQADALVRCGRCGRVFNGRQQLLDAAESASADPETIKRLLLAEDDGGRGRHRGVWWLAVLLAALALIGQLAYLQRAELGRLPGLGPWVERLCAAVPGCRIPPRRDPARILLLSRNVYAHPRVEGALVITATIANGADFPQPPPTLLVSLSNVRGQVVARRYFEPAEYLPPDRDPDRPLEPGESVSITLEVLDPGQEAMAFELDFL
ncbi:MAG: hypothetical protein KatS3mg121_0720 [Gammaproteobacteria bacterium]|nr:MAG: hypothetical protein KatS3mg121_0720 [Gammaproteobacteria bacterium]